MREPKTWGNPVIDAMQSQVNELAECVRLLYEAMPEVVKSDLDSRLYSYQDEHGLRMRSMGGISHA